MIPMMKHWTGAFWLVLIVCWWLPALTAKRSVQRQSFGSRLLQSLVGFAGIVLIFNLWRVGRPGLLPGWLNARFIPATAPWVLAGVALYSWPQLERTPIHQAESRTHSARTLHSGPPSHLHRTAYRIAGHDPHLRSCPLPRRSPHLRARTMDQIPHGRGLHAPKIRRTICSIPRTHLRAYSICVVNADKNGLLKRLQLEQATGSTTPLRVPRATAATDTR